MLSSELSYHRNSGDERKKESATTTLQDINSPLRDKAKQNNFLNHCGLFRRIVIVTACVQMAEAAWA